MAEQKTYQEKDLEDGLRARSGLLASVQIDWHEFVDTAGEEAAAAKAAAGPAAIGPTTSNEDVLRAIMAGIRPSKRCPTCQWLCDVEEIECFKCGFRFNVNTQLVDTLSKLGADLGKRQVRLGEDVVASRLALAETSTVDSFLLRLQAEQLACATGFDDLISLPQLNIEQYDYQIDTVKRVLQSMRGTALLGDEVGLGKAEPLDMPVLTPSGWKLMGDLAVGEEVIGADGRGTRVIGIYPQGELDAFRVTFSDGSWVECSDDHLWAVNDSIRRWRGNPHQVLPLSEIRAKLTKKNGQRRHFIPMVEPVHFASEQELPLAPYLLGALLGDGGITHWVSFTTADVEMVERVKALVPATVEVKHGHRYMYRLASRPGTGRTNAVADALRDLGLFGRGSHEKFIPERYLYASPAQRLAVLQGLLDTDGCVRANDNNIEYSTSSEQLALDVQFIVRSLGGVARIRSRIPHYTYKGGRRAGRRSYRMSIQLPAGIWPFTLMRKASIYHPRRKYPPTRNIVSVEHVGRKPMQCIKVAADDGLFVTKDFIVTHNTIEAGMVLKELDLRGLVDNVLVLAPSSLVKQWREQLSEKFGIDLRIIEDEDSWAHVPPGAQRLVMSIDLAKRPTHLTRILKTDWDMLIVDEAHYLKNRGADRYKSLNKIRKRYCLMLTATPIQNDLVELYSLISMLKPGHLGTIRGFKNTYLKKATAEKPVQNAEALQRLLYEVMVRNRRATVGLKLPRRLAAVVHLQASWEEMSLYNDLSDYTSEQLRKYKEESEARRQAHQAAVAAALQQGLPKPKRKVEMNPLILPLQMIQRELASSAAAVAETIDGLLTRVDLKEADRAALAAFAQRARGIKSETKIDATADIVNNSGGQFVIFVEFKASAQRLIERLRRDGITYGFYHGGLNMHQKDATLRQFKEGAISVLIATRAGAEGLNLQFAHQMINFDLPWNPMAIEQRIGRLHRIGQKNEVLIYNLTVEGTVEERILDVLARKLKIYTLVVGETDMVLGQMDTDKSFEELVQDARLKAKTVEEARRNIEALGETVMEARAAYDKIRTNNAQMDAVLFNTRGVTKAA